MDARVANLQRRIRALRRGQVPVGLMTMYVVLDII